MNRVGRPKWLLLATLTILTVVSVAAKVFSATPLDEGIRELSIAILPQLQKLTQKRIAVVDFTDLQGPVIFLGRFVADELSASLAVAGGGIRVIDRQHLSRIIQEQRLSIYGITDPGAVKRLGQLAGVDAIVVGSITDLGNQVRITIKILSTTTGDIAGAAQTSVVKDSTVERLLGENVSQPSGSSQTAATTAGLPFKDEFTGSPNPDWRTLAGRWLVRDGAYTIPRVADGVEHLTVVGGLDWDNYVIGVDIARSPYGDEMAVLLRVQDRLNFVRLQVDYHREGYNTVYWVVRENGVDSSPIASVQAPRGKAFYVRIEVKGHEYSASINGTRTSFTFPKWIRGGAGLMIKRGIPAFDNFTIARGSS